MLIKQKSLVVAVVSSFVISLVLVFTLIGYLVYIELKGEEFNASYERLLQKVNARFYSKYIVFEKLAAGIEGAGVLKDKAVIEGSIKNCGYKDITDMLIKVAFTDKDGAVLYEAVFRPQEPSLGGAVISYINYPLLKSERKAVLKNGGTLSFKKILTNCPAEITRSLAASAKGRSGWTGGISAEIVSADF
jgi:hypothetical protein